MEKEWRLKSTKSVGEELRRSCGSSAMKSSNVCGRETDLGRKEPRRVRT